MSTMNEKLIIDLPEDGEVIEICKGGRRVGGIAFRETTAGNLQLIVNGTTVPALTIGGDRYPADVQVSPTPKECPPVHFSVFGLAALQGKYGDVWLDGTMVAMPQQMFFDSAGNIASGVPIDPRGAIVLGRTRYPNANEALGLIRLFRKAQDGVIREEGRLGLSKFGFPFINGGGNDTPRISFRFDANWLKVNFLRPSDGAVAELCFDDAGRLKYQGTAGTVTTVAQA